MSLATLKSDSVLYSHNRDNGTTKQVLSVLFMGLIFLFLIHSKHYCIRKHIMHLYASRQIHLVFVISSYISKVHQIYSFIVLVACFAYMHAEIINIKYRKAHKGTKLTLGIFYGSSVIFCQLKNVSKNWGNKWPYHSAENRSKFTEVFRNSSTQTPAATCQKCRRN